MTMNSCTSLGTGIIHGVSIKTQEIK